MPKVIDIYNSTVCGYIGASDTQWENSSCTTTFDVNNNYIYCSCRHMSYYAIINDYLTRENSYLEKLNFKNWFSIIPFGYMIVVFIFGLIYTYSKDNNNFQALNQQDNTLGLDLLDQNSLTIKSILIKRKVFYSGFGNKFSFCTLFRILYLRLHPITQLKHQFDPQIPRFYKFMGIYSRVMIILGVSFYYLREFKDIDAIINAQDLLFTLIKIFAIIGGGSLILIPIPSLLYRCSRSRYFLIRQRMLPYYTSDDEKVQQINSSNGDNQDGPNQLNSQNRFTTKDVDNHIQPQQKGEQERFTNLKIDPNLPLKLLFELDKASTDRIIQEYSSVMKFSSGQSLQLSKKLLELEEESKFHAPTSNQTKLTYNTDQINIHDQNKVQQYVTESGDMTTNRNLQPNKILKYMSNNSTENKLRNTIADPTALRNQLGIDMKSNKLNTGIVNHNDINFQLRHEEEIKDNDDEIERNIPVSPHQAVLKQTNFSKHARKITNVEHEIGQNDLSSRSHLDQLDYSSNKLNNFNLQDGDQDISNFQTQMNAQQNQMYTEDIINQNLGLKTNTDLIVDSFIIGSLESQIDADEKKELVEQSNYCGRLFCNILSFIINIGILVAVFYFYTTEEYYLVDNNWIWIASFFAAQLLGFVFIDFFAILFMALFVAKCCRRKKRCLAKWMRETLIIYEDYKFIMDTQEAKVN